MDVPPRPAIVSPTGVTTDRGDGGFKNWFGNEGQARPGMPQSRPGAVYAISPNPHAPFILNHDLIHARPSHTSVAGSRPQNFERVEQENAGPDRIGSFSLCGASI